MRASGGRDRAAGQGPASGAGWRCVAAAALVVAVGLAVVETRRAAADGPPRTTSPAAAPWAGAKPTAHPTGVIAPIRRARPAPAGAAGDAAARLDRTGDPDRLQALKQVFRRPPAPTVNADEAALGAALFNDVRLSADHRMSCATCHDPARGFTDGRTRARGNAGRSLQRNTPALWNLATATAFYWDARVSTLEAQAKDAIEREHELDSTLEAAARWLAAAPGQAAAFMRVYDRGPLEVPANITRAIAAYQRTLVSPPTRFDRWIDGDGDALSEAEVAGFRIFTGKGRCLACHGGWRFTDDLVHDIGLPSRDRGAAAISGKSRAERTFKTPSLREALWSAPYMHDGSLRTLDDVVAHYAGRLQRRPSLASELAQPIRLAARERANLVAFLKTLSSADRPRAP